MASLPSIVVGLFGLLIFVNATHWGFTLLSGALAISVLNLPALTRVSENAITAAAAPVKEASLGLGATRWQTISRVVLPSAIPQILTGVILAAGRIFGEAAALLYTAGMTAPKLNFSFFSLTNSGSAFSVMRPAESLAVYIWKLNSEGMVPDAAEQTANLDLYYGTVQALKKVNLKVKKNSVTALIGPSGCGKSTFLRTLNRMNDLIDSVKIEGEVLFEDKDVYSDYDVIDLRKRIGMVFQAPNPFPMSIYNNVAYGPRIHGVKNKGKLDEIVEKSLKGAAIWDEVKDRLNRNALGLSGGQQQRLCIARTLAVEPDVLLMDEPTSALDPISTLKIEELMDILKKKYTIIIVTHNMQQAGRISDYTAFFLNGEVVEDGKTENIFYKPKDKRTEDYITGRFG